MMPPARGGLQLANYWSLSVTQIKWN